MAMFGRQVALVLRRPAHAYLSRPATAQCPPHLCVSVLSTCPRRLYATPAKPKKGSIGEPTRTVKRAVKKAAAKPISTSDAPAEKASSARPKVAAAKKPKAKVKAARPKKAAASSKPASRKRAEKVLTDEQAAGQKARVEKRAASKTALTEKKLIKELKPLALDPPRVSHTSAWMQFSAVKRKGERPIGMTVPEARQAFAARTKELAAEWRAQSAAGIEHYNHLAHTVRAASVAAYDTWVQQHTPEQIHAANKARARLRLRLPRKKQTHSAYLPIEDPRQAKRAITSYMQFSMERHRSGDFTHIALLDRVKLISQEWKALSEGEKKKYIDLQTEAITRYADEYSTAYGYAPPGTNGNGGQQVASAAA